MENQEQNQVQAAQAAPDVPARVLVAPPKPLELERNMKAAWKSWISSYEWYAKANRVNRQDADIQAAIFMSTIGKNVLEIFEGFGLTEEEKEDVNIIKARFQQYFIPRANDIYEGFALRQIMQGEDEKFHEFVTRLTVQAKKANYQALTDRMILEQLVIGVRWEKMKEKLLSTPDITLNQAIDFCLAYELALAQKEAIIKSEKVDKSEVKVDAIQKEAPKEKSGKEYDCQRCGRKHAFRRCPAFGKECRKCGEKGHFANCCKKEAVKVQEVKVEDHDDELETFKICEVSSRDRKSAWIHTLKCRGESFAVKIDTGADCCVINAKVLGTLKVDTIEASKVKKLITYNGSEIPVLGQIVLPCYFGSEEVPLTFQVIKTQCMPVIDGEAAIKAGLIKRLLEVKFPEEVFEGLGCVKNFTYEIDLIDNPKFTVHPARVIPYPTLRSPAERLLGRKTRNPLIVSSNSLKPILVNDNSSQLQILRDKQKQYADRGAKEYSQMPIGTRVRLKDQDGRWLAGEIADKATDRSYVVKLEDGRAVRRNRRFIAPTKVQGNFSHGSSVDVDVPDVQTPAENDDLGEQGEENREDPMPVVPVEENVLAPSPSVRTRSGRLVVPPQRLNL
uniref:CCHC-type domain-containing protein n=1 Tax=Lutzomyia longipalpis TaxID=7200 RepID=A0A1B0C8L3_LUTLO